MRDRGALMALALLFLSACGGGDDEGEAAAKQAAFSLFNPVAASATVPFPFDGFFAGATDPTLNIPNPSNAPFVTQANLLDGFSTTASLFTDLLGPVDFDTLDEGLRLIDSATGQVLVQGIDYTVQGSVATSQNPISGAEEPISSFRSRILIEPLKPLAPATRYIVVLTREILSSDGVPAEPAELFRVVRSATPVAEQNVQALTALTPTQKATLETVRTDLIRPIVSALASFGIAEENIVLAWSFTTQSVSNTLDRLQAQSTATTLGLRNTGLTLANLDAALPAVANVYAGSIALPYYLSVPAAEDPTAPLTSFWLADAARPDVSKTFLGNPCGAFVAVAGLSPSVSTTACFPDPVKQADVTVPVLVTVPNANSGHAMPEGGWPTVIFQHGITGNRSQMLAIAPALSLAGFAVVAIDLPLHGITPQDSTAALRINGVPERTFDVDYVDNSTGAAGPDAAVDASGTHFINLSSLITSRDNLRQAVSDLIVLTKSVPGAVLLDTGGAPESTRLSPQIRYVGHSLGGIVGGTLLGVDQTIGAATLAMPGGGIAKLLDASKTFGPRIAAGLAASGLTEGSDDYETFERFAQTLVDSADPINYAVSAATRHPIHLIEVINDKVVPNVAEAGAANEHYDRVTISGYLSGTGPLYQTMGLAVQGPLDVPLAAPEILLGPAARNNAVVFSQGDHGSILSPAASAAAMQEMQRQTASFLASNGLCLPIGGSCP